MPGIICFSNTNVLSLLSTSKIGRHEDLFYVHLRGISGVHQNIPIEAIRIEDQLKAG